MKKNKVLILILVIISIVMLTGCISNNKDNVKEVTGFIDDVETTDGYVIVHFKNDGMHRFYPDTWNSEDVGDVYMELRSYMGTKVSILYYVDYRGDGKDTLFHIMLEEW